jgi:inner membrane transporter RhtA
MLLCAFMANPRHADIAANMMKPRPTGVRHIARKNASNSRKVKPKWPLFYYLERTRRAAPVCLPPPRRFAWGAAPLYLQQMSASAPQAPTRRDSATAVSLVVIVGLLMQAGSAVAVLVIHAVGVAEALWLRTALAALMLAVARPRLVRLPAKGDRLPLVALTLSLLAMNFSFYEAISRAPVGVVVALEFLGPLGVAVADSRRILDGLWVVLAAVGIALLAEPSGTVSLGGLLFALLAAACWAAFILSAKRTVRTVGSLRATILMLIGSAVLLTPVFLATGVKVAGQTRALLLGLAVAVLSSALPYALELAAIRRVRPSTYGVLLSIEPAIAALWGFVILSQRLAVRELFGIVAIVLAAAGAAWTSTADLPRPRRRGGGARSGAASAGDPSGAGGAGAAAT